MWTHDLGWIIINQRWYYKLFKPNFTRISTVSDYNIKIVKNFEEFQDVDPMIYL